MRGLTVAPLPGQPGPTAFRAVARVIVDRRGRERRLVTYDARWPDGWVRLDVDLVDLMYRRAPADFELTRTAMLAALPATGTGPWIAYATGDSLDDQPTGAWAGARSFAPGTPYFRVLHLERVPPWRRSPDVYEVMHAPGITRLVGRSALWDALGRWAGTDSMLCHTTASTLYRAGEHDTWVQYSYGGVATTADILAPVEPAP